MFHDRLGPGRRDDVTMFMFVSRTCVLLVKPRFEHHMARPTLHSSPEM